MRKYPQKKRQRGHETGQSRYTGPRECCQRQFQRELKFEEINFRGTLSLCLSGSLVALWSSLGVGIVAKERDVVEKLVCVI